jgi:hypothetical protein
VVILTPIERETFQVFLKGKAHAHSCPDLPLGDSSNKYGFNRDMLTRVWNEVDYRIDVCHITKGGHIEHL